METTISSLGLGVLGLKALKSPWEVRSINWFWGRFVVSMEYGGPPY